ncbi:MAG: type IV pilus twitching motility protein PilT, partial [Candidatus Krumholzibacteriia bacterium]
MSSWIDPFLEALADHGAGALILIPGERPTLRHGSAEKTISRQTVATPHLTALLLEAGGPELCEEIESRGAATWTVERFGKRFRFNASLESDDLRIVVTPENVGAGPDGGGPDAHLPVISNRGPREIEPVESHPPARHEDSQGAASIPATLEPPSDGASGSCQHDEVLEEMHALLITTHRLRASDLHLTSKMPPMVRKDGAMQPLDGQPRFSAAHVRELLMSITPPRQVEELKRMWDSDFGIEIRNVSRFRVNIFNDRVGLCGVFRVVPTRTPTCEELGLPPTLIDTTQLSKGIVLVTGPTGSGKSTTLSALLDHANSTRHDHIITIEDPIEFVHDSRSCLVNQREVGTHAQSFKRALREALREDPDIVLVGEMRDLETVHIALETAETGHLVYATLHTTSAPATIDRLIDQFPPEQQAQIRVMLA